MHWSAWKPSPGRAEGRLQGLQPGRRRTRRTVAHVPPSRRARARLVHLRTAERPRAYLRGDRGAGRRGRHHLRAVRPAHAVPGHDRLREVGGRSGQPGNHRRRRFRHEALAHPQEKRPKLFTPHPTMEIEEIRVRTQHAWDQFYSWGNVWKRSNVVKSMKSRIAFMLADLEAVPADVREHRHRHRQRARAAVRPVRPHHRHGHPARLRRQADARTSDAPNHPKRKAGRLILPFTSLSLIRTFSPGSRTSASPVPPRFSPMRSRPRLRAGICSPAPPPAAARPQPSCCRFCTS